MGIKIAVYQKMDKTKQVDLRFVAWCDVCKYTLIRDAEFACFDRYGLFNHTCFDKIISEFSIPDETSNRKEIWNISQREVIRGKE